MIVVRRVRHKRSALFQKPLMPRGWGFYDGHNSGSMDAFVSHQKWREKVNKEKAEAKRVKRKNRAERIKAKADDLHDYYNYRQLRRDQKEMLRDPWDDWFDPEKIDRNSFVNSNPSSPTRLLPGGVDPDSPPQTPNQSTKKPLPKPLNSKALLAGLALAGAVGAVGAGAYFIRRRRSKKGKTIVERVRR